jgi:hypothetical protein
VPEQCAQPWASCPTFCAYSNGLNKLNDFLEQKGAHQKKKK